MSSNSTLETAVLNFIQDEITKVEPVGLPTDAKQRKALPVYSGVVRYFPLALAAVSGVSNKGNAQHNPGKPLHWDRDKSKDQPDAMVRHTLDLAILDNAGEDLSDEAVDVLAQIIWRAMAELQLRLEKRGGL